MIRGKDETGRDLIIAQDYITDGVRLRAQELATLELGPETDLELRSKLTAEISAERFTRIDRAMMAEAGEGILDLRPEAGQVRADFDRTLRIGRLQTLARYGLAKESDPGVWKLSEQLEPTLRELGERGDIVKAINRALKARGEERALESYSLHGEEASAQIVGRVIDKRLTDELGERLGLVVDGVDGRVHHVALGAPAMAAAGEGAAIGSIVEIAPAPTGPRPADRNIARIAGDFRRLPPERPPRHGRIWRRPRSGRRLRRLCREPCPAAGGVAPGRASSKGSTPTIGASPPTSRPAPGIMTPNDGGG